MPPMEIERKFTVKALPENLDSYPFHLIEQAYLNTDPVLRIRRQILMRSICWCFRGECLEPCIWKPVMD